MAQDVGNLKSLPEDGFSITPHDTNELTHCPAVVYIGGAGNVKVKTIKGTTLTFNGVLAGTILPVKCSMVFNTDTTATNMIALY